MFKLPIRQATVECCVPAMPYGSKGKRALENGTERVVLDVPLCIRSSIPYPPFRERAGTHS